MPLPRRLLAWTALAIALSLGLKATMPPAARASDHDGAARDLRRMAAARGYDARVETGVAMMPLVVARRGDCRRRLYILDADGSQLGRLQSLRRPGEGLAVHYRGRTRTDFPRVEPVARRFAQSYLGNLGIRVSVPAIVGELAKGGCASAPPLPFAALRVAARPPAG